MLTSNIKLVHYKNSKFSKKNNFELNKIKKIDWLNKFKLLRSFSNNYKYSFSKKNIKKYKKINYFRVIGMGGSALGSEAIYSFLKNKINKKFQFINNLNPKLILKKESNNKVLNIVISKSGNTLETISNFNLLIRKKNSENIFITENSDNYLNKLAAKLKCEVFEHKNYIGGRYSVLSETGMLPAELMGLNERKFKRLNYLVKNNSFLKNLILNVNLTLKFLREKKCNSIILNYDERSECLFKWYQQLISESLGKKSKGILPVISNMPKDNHSILQLYLDGPKNNFFTFFSVNEKKSNKINSNYLFKPYSYLKNKSLQNIIMSQKKATENVFIKKKIPFRSFEILNRSEKTLGELFCFFVLETILLGKALKVNPFDQPSVELIKKETKKILS